MATHDYVLDNASGANFRSDLNNALAAIVSNNSSSSEPSTKYAYQWWADTNTGLLKIRNSANDGWITLLQLDGTLTLEDGSNSAPALGFRDDLNTGIFSSAADTLDVTCGGTTRGSFSSTGLAVTGNVTATTFVGDIDAVDGDFDGTLEADAITVAGVALATVIAGTTVTTATNANHVSVADNESTNENNLIPFIEDASATGNVGLESDGDFTYNPSTGTVTATKFSGETVLGDTSPQLGGDLATNSNNINFPTGDKAQFGDNAQLKIEYDGSNSIILAGGNGDLQLTSNHDDVQIQAADNFFVLVQGGEDSIKCLGDGSVELYEDATKVFETTASGITVTGAVTDSKGSLRSIPSNYVTSAYTLVASDAGKAVIQAGQTSVTIPNSTLTGGDAVTIINGNTGSISIVSGTGLVLFFSADGTQGNRTLGPRGIATVYFHSATYAYISGSGLS